MIADLHRQIMLTITDDVAADVRGHTITGALGASRLTADGVALLRRISPKFGDSEQRIEADRREQCAAALPVEWSLVRTFTMGEPRWLLTGSYFGCSGADAIDGEVASGVHSRSAEFEVLR